MKIMSIYIMSYIYSLGQELDPNQTLYTNTSQEILSHVGRHSYSYTIKPVLFKYYLDYNYTTSHRQSISSKLVSVLVVWTASMCVRRASELGS